MELEKLNKSEPEGSVSRSCCEKSTSTATKTQKAPNGTSWEVRCVAIGVVMCIATAIQSTYQYVVRNSMQLMLMDFVNQSVESNFGFSIDESEMVWVWPTMLSLPIVLGLLFAVWVAPWLADTRGRRVVVMAVSPALMLFAAIAMTAAKPVGSAILLFVGFILGQLAISMGDPTACSYMTEISPQHLRGTIGTIPLALRPIGGSIGAITASVWMFGTEDRWHWVYVIMGLMSLVMLLYKWIPESPKHLLINKGDRIGALKTLRRLNVPPKEQTELMKRYEIERDRDSADKHGKAAITELLFRRRHLRLNAVILLVSLTFPISCAVLLINYSTAYFVHVGLSLADAQLCTLIRNVLTLFVGILSTYLTDKIPRRTYLIGGMLLNSLFIIFSCFFGAFKQQWSAWLSASSILIANCFACSPRAMAHFYANELVTTRYRAAAGMFSFAVRFFGYLPQLWLFNYFLYIMGNWCLIPWAVVGILSSIILYYIMPETRNRQSEDVYLEIIGDPLNLLQPADEAVLKEEDEELNLTSVKRQSLRSDTVVVS